MSGNGITTRDELAALRRRHMLGGGAESAAPGDGGASHDEPRADEAHAWVLPAPSRGRSYTRQEVADMMGVSEYTVRGWIYDGVDGEKLRTLTAPRGRISTAELRRFLEAVNGQPVAIEGHEG